MSTRPNNVLILGARSPIALDLARSFSRVGASVYLGDSFPTAFAMFSQSVTQSFRLPSPRFETEAFGHQLLDLINRYGIDLLLPTCEEIFFVAKIRNKLPKTCHVFVDSFDKLISLHDKFSFVQLLEKHGLPAPKSISLKDQGDFEKNCEPQRRWILKPRFSRFADDVVFPNEIATRIPSLDWTRGWMAQEFLAGRHYASYTVAFHGEVLAHTTYSCFYRHQRGASLFFKHEPHEGIESFVRKVVRDLNFHGQIAFDFIETPSQLFAIECNPRGTSGIHILARNHNFASAFWGESIETPSAKMALMLGMLTILPSQIKARRFTPFLQDLISGKDAIFSVRDMRPFFVSPFTLAHFWWIARKSGLSLSQAMTHDIAFNEESME